MLSRNRSEILETFGAGEVAGFITVNINHRLSLPEINDICLDAQPAALSLRAGFCRGRRGHASQDTWLAPVHAFWGRCFP